MAKGGSSVAGEEGERGKGVGGMVGVLLMLEVVSPARAAVTELMMEARSLFVLVSELNADARVDASAESDAGSVGMVRTERVVEAKVRAGMRGMMIGDVLLVLG